MSVASADYLQKNCESPEFFFLVQNISRAWTEIYGNYSRGSTEIYVNY